MENESFLTSIWYFALPARDLKPGKLVRKILLDQPMVIGRGADGQVFALRDVCPHRAVPLSSGRLYKPGDKADGVPTPDTQVECPYHGWRFRTDGRCAAIPVMTEGQNVDLDKIRVRRYPAREQQGLIWVFITDTPANAPVLEHQDDPAFGPPELPGVGDRAPGLVFSMTFQCHVDQAVIGLMDPAHGPYVHRSWFWRTGASMHEKAKRFGPRGRGFAMLKHKPSKNSFFYRVLGTDLTTEIAFQIPGIRTEHITLGEGTVLGVTITTPINDAETEVTQMFYWTQAWVGLLKPIVRAFGHVFLSQDRDMVALQRKSLDYDPRMILVGDADLQAKWYYKLKKAWTESVDTDTPFVNPLTEEVTLRWRS